MIHIHGTVALATTRRPETITMAAMIWQRHGRSDDTFCPSTVQRTSAINPSGGLLCKSRNKTPIHPGANYGGNIQDCIITTAIPQDSSRVWGLGSHRLHSSSFMGLPDRILCMSPKKELLWSLWVVEEYALNHIKDPIIV